MLVTLPVKINGHELKKTTTSVVAPNQSLPFIHRLDKVGNAPPSMRSLYWTMAVSMLVIAALIGCMMVSATLFGRGTAAEKTTIQLGAATKYQEMATEHTQLLKNIDRTKESAAAYKLLIESYKKEKNTAGEETATKKAKEADAELAKLETRKSELETQMANKLAEMK
jgi:hypothetical protein